MRHSTLSSPITNVRAAAGQGPNSAIVCVRDLLVKARQQKGKEKKKLVNVFNIVDCLLTLETDEREWIDGRKKS